MWSNPHNGGESRNFPAGRAQRGRFSLDTGACLTAADIVSLFKASKRERDSITMTYYNCNSHRCTAAFVREVARTIHKTVSLWMTR